MPTFPNAQYYAQEGEWQHGREQYIRDAISYISDNYDPLIQERPNATARGDQEIVPEYPGRKCFPGHTAQHAGGHRDSGGQTACYISDLIPTAAHIDLTWVMAFDLFPTRDRSTADGDITNGAIPEKWLTAVHARCRYSMGYKLHRMEHGKLMARLS